MAFSVQMPALGESVTEGTVTRWLKQEGDQVAVDEPLLEVSTDKVDTEIPSPAAGVLSRIVVAEDQTVEVGAELAVISESGDGRADRDGGGAGREDTHSRAGGGAAPPRHDEPGAAEPSDAASQDAAAPQDAAASQDAAAPQDARQEPAGDTGDDGDTSGDGGTAVTMPALGESVTEGTVTRWLKQVGDTVTADEPLLEVSTDKVDTEIPSPVAGTLLEITVGEDQTVEVGAQLARIGNAEPAAPALSRPEPARPEPARPEPARQPEPRRAEDAWSPPGAADQPPPRPAKEASPTRPPAQQPAAARASAGARPPADAQQVAETDGQLAGSPYVTPLVRKLAAEHDVDLAGLQGTGVGGRIRKQDVLAAAEAARQAAARPAPEPTAGPAPATRAGATAQSPGKPSALRGRTEKMSRLRQVIARRMVESLQTSAQLTTVIEVDVTRIARLRDRAKREFEAREGVKLSFLPFFAKAAVEALKQHPQLNASIDSETNEVTYHGAEHLGMAVDTERGLLVPVIHDAGDLNIAGLARRIADVAERTRNNKVTPDELSGGTFTLTNTGSRGALFDTPIINQPQVAILGTGAVVKRPVVAGDENGDTIAIRSMMFLALSYDHRLVDGADAARFLTTVRGRLEAGNFESDL